jgi:hypothetical protein
VADRLTELGRNGVLGMPGDIVVRVDGRVILLKAAVSELPGTSSVPIQKQPQ